jgi:hypothetical protein
MAKNIYKIENELYIVDDTEEINKDTKTCWCIDISCNELVLHQGVLPSYHYKHYKKIIMTTDKSINVLCSCGKDCGAKENGIQPIPDEFLEWFVKNPSCESVEITYHIKGVEGIFKNVKSIRYYGLIIPKEIGFKVDNGKRTETFYQEHKQETLEEAKIKHGKFCIENNIENPIFSFDKGAKWQQEQMYSEEEVLTLLLKLNQWSISNTGQISVVNWFEQFKKK